MKRQTFLTLASIIAMMVGSLVILFTTFFLEQVKGVPAHAGTKIWVTQTGVVLFGIGIIAFLVRKHEDSATLKMFLIGNIFIQIGLALSEIIGYTSGVLTKFSGILPNTILHIILSLGFIYYANEMNFKAKEGK